MRYSGPESPAGRTQVQRAAVFVDYDNLYHHLSSRVGNRERPDEVIGEILNELQRYLAEELQTQTAMSTAFADFGDLDGNGQFIQRALYLQGIETRFVPSTMQRNASEIQLCVDAIDVLNNRPDLRSFVFVTGDRPYLPLVQHVRRFGAQALVVTLAPPPLTKNLPYVEDDIFVNAVNFLQESARRSITPIDARHRVQPRNGSAPSSSASPTSASPSERPLPVEHRDITGAGARYTLEIIEEHFGQYEEVYLTPLLRKLSEMLDESRHDPKSLISELESCGAVWLEKRRGFPYDYTVLIVDGEHPDVKAIQEEVFERTKSDFAPYYEDDEDLHDEDEAIYDEYEDEDDEAYDDDEVYLDEDAEELS